ncbi:MAG TPA: 2-amino-4-hydroxy-6-hydroxymethyldihydropteridine diphosphokinase [Candidatus Hydrogenedentes bacterium]|nr:2-amino-4-hydroxy-6-hydroxymethyldihydropteridine diphosphokinase [Candidatus Hydrogenedentota bacterium]
MNEPSFKTCYISVGGNIHPEETIPRALEMLHAAHIIRGISTFYRTPPINRPEQPHYLNGAVMLPFEGQLRELKYAVLRPIEEALGRKRTVDKFAARAIDLDVVLCGQLVIEEPGLVIPDPDIRKRPFLAAALLELNRALVLPDDNTSLLGLVNDEQRRALVPDIPFTTLLRERFLK